MQFPFSFWKSSSGSSGGSPITVSSNWGTTVGSTSTISSFARTLTVPVGNAGQVLLGIVNSGSGTVQYQYNGGTLTTFVDGTVITVATASTLAFKALSMASGDIINISVQDNSTNDPIGFSLLERS